uniref:TFIIS-type domain-containing protein n=1 Tax=viral metagenome TaxID=1070528 RepID=A0A6C0BYZ4_9ZZZZ
MSIVQPKSFRENLRKKLNKYVKNKNMSENLEKGIYNFTIKEAKMKKIIRKWDNKMFIQIYLDRFKSIYINITKKKSLVLKRLKKGEFLAHELANMTHQEMEPPKWKEIIEMKIKRDKSATTIDLSAATDQFTCGRCKKNKCTYYQMQTRSADEPMTTFITCLNCGNNWKQ